MAPTGYSMATLAEFKGREIGTSGWLTVDQRRIDEFADCTGDRQWIHVDVERAPRSRRRIVESLLTEAAERGLPRPRASASREPNHPSGESQKPLAIARTPSALRRSAFDRSDPRPRRRPGARAGNRLRRPAALHLHDARRAREPARLRARRARRRARRHRRDHGLGQPSLPRVLLRGADDGRGAAHRERAHLAGAGALHDQSRRTTT